MSSHLTSPSISSGLLTVQQLSRSVLQGTVLNDIIREQLHIIDKKILNTSKQIGTNSLIYDLPVTFTNMPASRTDTRIMVYYHIIKSLEERGYSIKIKLSESKATINIEWNIGMDKSHLAEMESFLQKRNIS